MSLLRQRLPQETPLRVLLIENLPRYEYRFLRDALLADKGLLLSSFLASADDDWPQPASKGVEPLTRDAVRTALLKGLGAFDVVVWGDIRLERFFKDAALDDAAKSLVDFAESGHGLLFIAGGGYEKDPPKKALADLLPGPPPPERP